MLYQLSYLSEHKREEPFGRNRADHVAANHFSGVFPETQSRKRYSGILICGAGVSPAPQIFRVAKRHHSASTAPSPSFRKARECAGPDKPRKDSTHPTSTSQSSGADVDRAGVPPGLRKRFSPGHPTHPRAKCVVRRVLIREAELRTGRSQAELGNEGGLLYFTG